MLNLRKCGWRRWSRDLQKTPGGTSWLTRWPSSNSPLFILLFFNTHGPETDAKRRNKICLIKKNLSKTGRMGNILSSVWKYLQCVQRKINIYYSAETQLCTNECVVRAAKVINPKSNSVFSLEIIIPLHDSNGHTRTLPFPLHLLILSSREKTAAMLTAQIDRSNSNQKITQQTGLDRIRSNIHTHTHSFCVWWASTTWVGLVLAVSLVGFLDAWCALISRDNLFPCLQKPLAAFKRVMERDELNWSSASRLFP